MSITLSREQVRRVDRLAVEKYRMPSLLLMENAGRNAAQIMRQRYGPAERAFIICGTGNNGGDGCVIARHLHNFGWTVRLMIAGERSKMSDDMRVNHDILEAAGLPIEFAPDRADQQKAAASTRLDEILVDGLLGTGFRGQVRNPIDELIKDMNAAARRAVVAVDVPSGLDCDTGEASNATIRTDLTITFVASKVGFTQPEAVAYVGETEVADIGVPKEAIEEVRGDRS